MSRRRSVALALAFACTPGQSGSSAGDDAGPCELAPDPGTCDAPTTRWYFDQQSQRCAPFTYNGCEGVVPFTDAPECQSACESCDALFDATQPDSSGPSFVVRNTGAATIFLQTFTPSSDAVGFRRQTFEIAGSGGALVTSTNECDFTCAAYDTQECSVACSDGGPPPPPIAIAPGGSFQGEWNGLHLAPFAMPARCLPDTCGDALTCGRWQIARDDDYTVRIVIAAATDCTDPACECTPNSDGWCALPEGQPITLVDPAGESMPFFFPTGETITFDL